MNTQPIGFMDSGVGGLTVLKEVRRLLPNENVVFLGDQARLPYGSKTPEEVQQFTLEIAAFLQTQAIKLLVIACNTATAAALPMLRRTLSIPVIGVIEPGSQAAIAKSRTGHIGVIATQGTVDSQAYQKTLQALERGVRVVALACPDFVTVVEANAYHLASTKQLVEERLSYFQTHPVDTLIMGCTHFPLLAEFIQSAMGNQVRLIDAGAQTAVEVQELLVKKGLANQQLNSGQLTFYTTGNPAKFDTIAKDWLRLEDISAKHVALKTLQSFN